MKEECKFCNTIAVLNCWFCSKPICEQHTAQLVVENGDKLEILLVCPDCYNLYSGMEINLN